MNATTVAGATASLGTGPAKGSDAPKAGIAQHVRAILSLVVGMAIAAGVVIFGPAAIEPVLVKLDKAATPAVVEAVFTAAIFGTLLVVGVIGGAITGVNVFRIGRRPLAMLGLGLFVGLFGLSVSAGYAGIAGALHLGEPTKLSAGLFLGGVALVLLQTAAEEVYFRGWLQPVFAKAWGPVVAIIVGALAFAALHNLDSIKSVVTDVNMFLGGLMFGILAAYGRSLLGAVAAHFAWNGSEQLILGLDPNPGVGSFGSIFNFELLGPASWGGSTEGLNASFAMTMALLALVVPLVLLVRSRLEPSI